MSRNAAVSVLANESQSVSVEGEIPAVCEDGRVVAWVDPFGGSRPRRTLILLRQE